MTILEQDKCVFMIIDIQEKLLNSVFNPEKVRKNSLILAETARILNIPVFVTEQYPKGLGKSIEGITFDNCYEKTSFNALDDINFDFGGKTQVVVFGIETHICVHQTVSALIKKGLDVTVAFDACGSRTEEHHAAGLDVMKSEGAKIKPVEMILFELIKSSKHPKFREVQALIK